MMICDDDGRPSQPAISASTSLSSHSQSVSEVKLESGSQGYLGFSEHGSRNKRPVQMMELMETQTAAESNQKDSDSNETNSTDILSMDTLSSETWKEIEKEQDELLESLGRPPVKKDPEFRAGAKLDRLRKRQRKQQRMVADSGRNPRDGDNGHGNGSGDNSKADAKSSPSHIMNSPGSGLESSPTVLSDHSEHTTHGEDMVAHGEVDEENHGSVEALIFPLFFRGPECWPDVEDSQQVD